jgi:predicted nucleic acid-binding protein
MRVYFDVCCLGRVFEVCDQPRMESERAAIQHILNSETQIISSDAVAYEIHQDPDEERRDAKALLDDDIRSETVKITGLIGSRAKELVSLGFGDLDAIHIACAESAGCDCLLTTDDRMIKRAKRMTKAVNVAVENPATWVLQFPQK